jgi:hypothetical protein
MGRASLCTIVGKISKMMRNGRTGSNEIPTKKKPISSSVGEGFVAHTNDESSSSPTPLSPVNTKTPDRMKKEKKRMTKDGDKGLMESLENMIAFTKDIAYVRKDLKD